MMEPFALLDFVDPCLPGAGSLFCAAFDEIIEARTAADVVGCLQRAAAAQEAGAVVVGFLAYEAAVALDRSLRVREHDELLPLVWLGVCRRPTWLDKAQREELLNRWRTGRGRLSDWRPLITEAAYGQAFAEVQRQIRDGATYQVNLTFPLAGRITGDRTHVYDRLTAAQQSAYCAWLHTGKWDIQSFSPELFFRVHNGVLTARPMKGTRTRGCTPAADRALSAELLADPKERAENVMIVDLLRNDLGRVADIGSVHVPTLFEAEKYPTVWQMTSTVEARLAPETDLLTLMRALFPCGSVTGAPKVKTMEIITDVEAHPRGIYCGGVGALLPGGDMVFNVAIRTLTITPSGDARYHVGGGIVADSHPAREYAECLAKAEILARSATPTFSLLETLRYEPGSGYVLLDRHLRRLRESAQYFSRPCDDTAIAATLRDAAAAWREPQRVRLLLAADGTTTVTATPLTSAVFRLPRRLCLADRPVMRRDVFLYHKTTHRAVYDRAAAARPAYADDVVLYNERGEITETTVANIALQLDGELLTPPVDRGLLNGTLRAELLATGRLREAVLLLRDLHRAERILLLNSVRGEFDGIMLRR